MDSWRVSLLGDVGVGKTALAERFASNTYDPSLASRPRGWSPENHGGGRAGGYRRLFLVDDRLCFVEVIDSQGQEEYATLWTQWVREGQGCILVYSVASRATFDQVDKFRDVLLKVKGPKPVFILVGNKCDSQSEREVSPEEGAAKARSFGCDFVETSAKTAQNVDPVFATLVRFLRRVAEQAKQGAQVKKRNKKCTIM